MFEIQTNYPKINRIPCAGLARGGSLREDLMQDNRRTKDRNGTSVGSISNPLDRY